MKLRETATDGLITYNDVYSKGNLLDKLCFYKHPAGVKT